jgi:hypothetical protein
MSGRMRKIVRIWWLLSAPPFVIGVAIAWAGVACDRLAVMMVGLACCGPLLLGLSIALGAFVTASPIVTVWLLFWTPREVLRQYRPNRLAAQPCGEVKP